MKVSNKKNKLANRVMKLIDDGKIVIDQQFMQPHVVMLIGMTGAGKSTLLNYINGVQLESFSENNGVSYKLKIKKPADALPNIDIGHSTVASCTRHPNSYSPPSKLFTYVDTAGFGDTGDASVDNDSLSSEETKSVRVAQDIANAYFRKAISDKASAFKMVLVVTHHDLDNRAGTLPKSLRDFAYFMQGIEIEYPDVVARIKNSISIVVTKVTDPNNQKILDLEKDIAELKEDGQSAENKSIKRKEDEIRQLRNNAEATRNAVEVSLRNFIEKSPALRGIRNMSEVLIHVVNENNFALFTTPSVAMDKSFDEAKKIRDLIENKTTFVDKTDARLGIRVSDENAGEVKKALDDLDIIAEKLAINMSRDITKHLKDAVEANEFRPDKIREIRNKCEVIKSYTNPRTLKIFFDSVASQVTLSDQTKKEYQQFNQLLTFLVGLLPEADRGKHSDTKNWIKELNLKSKLDAHIASANNILSAPTSRFENGKLVIQGYHIKTSQLDVEIQRHTGIQSIEVQALHTITVDNNLDETNEKCRGKMSGVNLSMIAPHVVVSGNRKIDLSGKNGSNQEKASNGIDGTDGAAVGIGVPGNNGITAGTRMNGSDGALGNQGTSAGNFVLICDKISDQEHLSVYLNGGNGGNGQEGGNGGNGGNGSGVNLNEEVLRALSQLPHHEPYGQLRVAMATQHIPRSNWIPTTPGPDCNTNQGFRLTGGEATGGGNAGKGGKGGDSGKQGLCNMVVAKQLLNLGSGLHAIDGAIGVDGDAGNGGIGGMHGRHAESTWYHRKDCWNGHYLPHYVDRGRASSGNTPTTLNDTNWRQIDKIPKQNVPLALLNYKIFLEQETAKNPEIVEEFLAAFEDHCEDIAVADAQVSVRDLLEEANALERFSQQITDIDFTPFYYSLLERIQAVALVRTRTPQELKVLEYLYVATLGSIARLNAAADNLLVVDIQAYLKNLIDRDFSALQTLQGTQLKQFYRQQYQGQIEGKIDEAKSFLDRLQEDISSRQDEIAPKIAELVAEVNQVRTEGAAHATQLEEKRRQLEAELRKQMMLGVLSVAIQGVGMAFGPAGSLVAGVVNAGISMANNPSFDTVMSFAKKVVDMRSELGALPTGADTTAAENDLYTKIRTMAQDIEPLITSAKSLLEQKHEGDARLAEMDAQIAEVNAYVIQLNAYLATVPAALSNYLESMVHDVENFQQALNDKSLVALDFSKLEIKRFFESLKQSIKTTVGNFDARSGFDDIVTRLEEAMDVSASICSRVQDYRDHMAFANFMAHLQTADTQAIDVGTEYQADVERLRLSLQQSIVQETYCRAVAATKQWAFPFAEKFFSAIPDLEATDYAIMARNLPILLRKLQEYKTCVTDMDQAIMLRSFNTAPTKPFFTWSYDRDSEKVESLLRGDKVILRAEANEQPLEAVKFKKIGIKLECKNGEKQLALNAALQNYKVTLEHSGISYYQYAGDMYQISNDKPLEIDYSFKMKEDGVTPVEHSVSWEKMAKGDILVSPYTSWVVQLKPMSTATGVVNLSTQFGDVKQHIKISLVGEGSYVDASKVKSNLHLDSYYHQVDEQGDLDSPVSDILSQHGLFAPHRLPRSMRDAREGSYPAPQAA